MPAVVITIRRVVAVDTPDNLTARLRGTETLYVQVDTGGFDPARRCGDPRRDRVSSSTSTGASPARERARPRHRRPPRPRAHHRDPRLGPLLECARGA